MQCLQLAIFFCFYSVLQQIPALYAENVSIAEHNIERVTIH